MKIISISESPKKNKRFRVYLDDGRYFDFGLKDYKEGTYIDHHIKQKRLNYISRHLANYNEKKLIDNLIASPALFSMMLLWGESTNIYENINILNEFLADA
jgi:hypothetical protein